MLKAFHFIHSGDGRNMGNNPLKFIIGVHPERDAASDDGIDGIGMNRVNRKVARVRHTVNDIDEKVVAVHSPDFNGDRIEGFPFLVIYRHNAISLL